MCVRERRPPAALTGTGWVSAHCQDVPGLPGYKLLQAPASEGSLRSKLGRSLRLPSLPRMMCIHSTNVSIVSIECQALVQSGEPKRISTSQTGMFCLRRTESALATITIIIGDSGCLEPRPHALSMHHTIEF